MPHQVPVLDWAHLRDHVALFLEMRLGKTLVAIRWALRFSPSRVLVVAPLTTLSSWASELAMEGIPAEKVLLLADMPTRRRLERALDLQRGWALVNYEALRAQPDLVRLPWDVIICDESTRIKNPQAQVTRLLLRNTAHIAHRAILSGLPAPEGLLDYVTQMQFLTGSFLGCTNYWQVRDRFFRTMDPGWEWIPKPGTRDAFKEEVARRAYVLSRKAAGIGSKKIYETRVVRMTPKQRKAYRECKRELTVTLDSGRWETAWVVVKLTWLSRLAGGFGPDGGILSRSKLAELKDLLTGELREEPVVVWFRFTRELQEARRVLRAAGVSCAAMRGATPNRKRTQLRQMFQAGKLRVLLVQLKLGRFGLDLSRASTAIYYSNSYDGEDRAQSEDRIVHPKKKDPLLLIDLVTKDSIDSDIVEMLRDKKSESKVFLSRLIQAQQSS